MTPPTKTYIGDGVYAELQLGQLVLTTENGIAVTNRIVIDGPDWQTLLDFVCAHAPQHRAAHEDDSDE